MIRTALVAMDGSPHGDAAASLGIEWARRFDAQLVGLGILDEPSITRPEPVSLGATGFKHRRDEKRLAHAHRHVLAFLAEFHDRCTREGVRCAAVEDVGAPHDQILREAQSCDVVIMCRESNFHFETQDRAGETLSRVLRSCPRPVVVVPHMPATGSGVLVAYGGGREIARTLQTFTLLGLAGGEPVDVIAVDRDRVAAERRLRHADEYLRAHRLAHHVEALITDVAPEDVILDEVRRRRPRLLVLGTHDHHPLLDLFVTSLSRAVLNRAPVPVFTGA